MLVSRALRLAAAAVLALGGALSPAGAADTAPYQIDAVMSLTGSGAFLGKEEQQALEAVERVQNARGGIHGRTIHFAISDDQSSPQVAVQLTNAIVAKHVPVMLGSSLVAQCSAMSVLTKDNGPVQYCFSPGVHPEHGSYVFSSSVSTKDQAIAMLRYFHRKGWNRVALLTSTDATGQDAERNLVAASAGEHGTQIVAQEHFNPGDVSVAAQLAHIKSTNPQALVGWTTGTPFGTVLRGIADEGLDIPIGAGNGNIIYAQMQQYRQFLPKQLFFAGVQYFRDPKQINGPLRAPIETFLKALAPAKPDLGQGLGYDPAMIVVDALRALPENPSAKQLRDKILALHGYVGINGVYDYHSGDNRGLGVGNAVLVRYDQGRDLFVPSSKPGGEPL